MRHCLLDSSFMIDLLNEISDARAGPAKAWLQRNASARLWITPVTMAEVLEGSRDPAAVTDYLTRYAWQGIHRVHARRVAELQRRAAQRLGENDPWGPCWSDTIVRRFSVWAPRMTIIARSLRRPPDWQPRYASSTARYKYRRHQDFFFSMSLTLPG
jgi:predicted nucleic acid-binding protein